MLPQLKKVCRITNAYASQRMKRVGVDMSVWMHQLALHHAAEVLEGDYKLFNVALIERATRFAEEGVFLHFVFDGDEMPGKNKVKIKRTERRARAAAYKNTAENQVNDKQYNAALKAAITITPPMKLAVQRELKLKGFSFVVAPYEADSQLAKMVSCVV